MGARQKTLQEYFLSSPGSLRPILTSLNGDNSWLISFPRPSSDRIATGKAYYHVVLEPWLAGPSTLLNSWIVHISLVTPPAISDAAAVEAVAADIEVAAAASLPKATRRHEELPEEKRYPGAIDAIFLGFHYNDHVDEATLRLFDKRIPIIATAEAAAIVRPWGYFDTINPLHDLGVSNTSWRVPELHPGSPLPSWITPLRLPGHAVLNFCLAFIWTHDTLDGQEVHEAILTSPHGTLLDEGPLDAFLKASPPTEKLAMLHGLKESHAVGFQTVLGAKGGLALYRKLGGVKYWLPTHHATLAYAGFLMRLLRVNDTERTLAWAIEEERKRPFNGYLLVCSYSQKNGLDEKSGAPETQCGVEAQSWSLRSEDDDVDDIWDVLQASVFRVRISYYASFSHPSVSYLTSFIPLVSAPPPGSAITKHSDVVLNPAAVLNNSLPLFAAVAGAIVIPDTSAFNGLVSSFEETVDFLSSEIANGVHSVKDTFKGELEHFLDEEFGNDRSSEFVPDINVLEHDLSNYTIYELISNSKYTTEFAKLVNEHDDVVKLLNSTKANYTLFAPVDKAFEDIPEHHKKPDKEFLEHLLNYHIGLDTYPASRILTTHTIPTALDEKFLGGEPQRLRISVGLTGVRVNVYSKVIAVNIKAKNGVIHAVNKILLPPTFIGRELSLFPSQFSTLLLAYEKTDFVKFIHGVETIGSTVFAPSNSAWTRLGIKANAFLFNTEQGKKYLAALLKYQIVANTTVYSDEIYYGDDTKGLVGENILAQELNKEGGGTGHFHIELPTLLEGKSVGVDIHSWKGWVSIVVNGYIKVGFQDGIAKNGVVQVVQNVPIPPHKHDGGKDAVNGEIEVEDLKERLSAYLDEEESDSQQFIGDL
ncbi:hypothetical protein G7046_g1271 [Stylonectria norvegica]|nr:hypothetical protein G7046_g1271 [Stylonectria norvegica]